MLTLRTRRNNAAFPAEWWRTIDRYSLFAFFTLTAIGLVLIGSASPVSFKKQAFFSVISLSFGVSLAMLSLKNARRIGTLVFFLAAIGIMLTLTPLGRCMNGSCRWIGMFQPSEFLKPGMIIFVSWMFSRLWQTEYPDFKSRYLSPYFLAALAAIVIPSILLVIQRDFGQTLLIGMIGLLLLYVSGAHKILLILYCGTGAGLGMIAILYNGSHVIKRMNSIFNPPKNDKFDQGHQLYYSKKAIEEGGLIGAGPGETTYSFKLGTESYNDFIYSLGAEQFGLIFTALLFLLYGIVIYRAFRTAARADHDFIRLSCTGLAALFFLQASIHIMVNVGLFPNKGMTLPFISYGGSSLVSLWLAAGLLICLTKRNPGGAHDL